MSAADRHLVLEVQSHLLVKQLLDLAPTVRPTRMATFFVRPGLAVKSAVQLGLLIFGAKEAFLAQRLW